MIAEFVVPGEPVSKERPQHGANRNTFTPKKTREAEKVIAMIAAVKRSRKEPVSVPVGVAVEFYCKHRNRKDADNMLKTVTDAMNAIVYQDDHLIHEVFVRVHRGVGEANARTEVSVWELDLSGA